MAVQPQTPYKEYTANGSTKSFALEFDCYNQDHLIVLVDDVEEIVGTWSLSNGAVVFGNAPTSGKKITIQRNTPFRRDGDFQSYDNSFRPGPVNKGFDWIWLKLQELGVADWILSTRINDLRAYVERQDSVLQENIDNLKTYVDDRDDELRAYLLEEIRKQGVALDQLDEYYNYLMQRLAQIAVSRGWDASFIADAGGSTQQDINDFGGAKWRNKAGGYALGATVKLDNGDIVKSTIDGNTNNPNMDMTGWINKEKEQDTINSLIASEGVNILSVYGGVNDFGAALELAFAKAKSLSVNTIKIPADTYTALTSADIELTEPLCLDFDAGVRVNVPNKIHVFNVNQNANLLTVIGRGVAFTPLWDTTDSSNSSIFKLLSRTTSKSLSIDSVCAYFKPESNDSIMFENIINASGLHLSNIDNCTFQARKPILNASHESGFGYSMGSTLNNTFLYSPINGTGLTLVNNNEYGCEGWAINGGEILCGRSIEVVDNLSRSYLPPLLKLNSVHMNCIAVAKIDNMSRVAFSNCDIQLKVVPHSESQEYGFDAVFELSGVQSFDLSQDTVITQVFENGATQADALNVVGFYENTRGLNSAFININSKMWIQQARPILKFNTGAQMYGVVNISISSEAMNYVPVVDQSDYSKVNVLSDSIIEVSNLPNGYVGSADTFDSSSGTLTLKNAPFGSFYAINTGVVPNGATINKIVVPKRLGEILSVYFDAQNLILNHTANFLQPTQANLLLRYGGAITFAVTGNGESKVINVAAPSFEVISDLPTSSTSWGQDGAKHYSGGFVYEYITGTGWVRWSASTF